MFVYLSVILVSFLLCFKYVKYVKYDASPQLNIKNIFKFRAGEIYTFSTCRGYVKGVPVDFVRNVETDKDMLRLTTWGTGYPYGGLTIAIDSNSEVVE